MEYYSLLLDIKDKIVLVVGQYKILEFKIDKLLEAGAKIRYLSESLSPKLKNYVDSGQMVYLNEKYQSKHLEDAWLVICGSFDKKLKLQIEQDTTQRHIFCNFVDEPEPSSFISPSVIRKGDIIISISTKGKSPALNRLLKKEINNFVGQEYSIFAELMGEVRHKVLENIPRQKERAELFDSIVNNKKILKLIHKNEFEKAKSKINVLINTAIRKCQ